MEPALTDAIAQLRSALADRYRIERELGRGGMATVFLARDLRHQRPVALKVLHPELAATLGPERFQQEIRLCAALQHPHILTVLDSGEAAGQLWFTMPFVEGESLRDRLSRERQLALEDALKIAQDVCSALGYAHNHGVVHRDIKPENILLTGEYALVADFGIARALAGQGERLTETGMAVGTPAYMSPEQAAGERQLDARSDLYALGCVLYEMLAGEPPFTGPTAQAVVARALTESPRPLHLTRETVPASVEAAISKAMARTPADRFPTAAQFAQALAAAANPQSTPNQPAPTLARGLGPQAVTRGPGWTAKRALALSAAAFLLGLGLLFAWRHNRSPEVGNSAGSSIAVLPFDNLGDSADAYFADGVTDAVRGKLTGLPGILVTARTSSIPYKKATKTPQQIGQELGVRYLLTGTVRWDKRAGGQSRVQVSPELIDVSTATSKWQQPFDASLTDVFQVQADIAGRVAQALGVALGDSAREQLAERPTRNLTAYDAYLKGEEISNSIGTGDPNTLRRSATYYRQAVTLDSTFAPAWVQLSRAYSLIYANAAPSPADDEAAGSAAQRALALAPGRPEGRLALGEYYAYVKQDNLRALEEYTKGRRLAPRHAVLLTATALAEQSLGRFEEAFGHLQEAQRLDPRAVNAARRLARTLLFLRRYPEARAAFDRALALAPDSPELLEGRAMVELAEGDLAAAHAVLATSPREVDSVKLVTYVANYWDLVWLLNEAQQQLLLHLTPAPFDDNRAAWALCIAQAYALRGDQARTRAYADSSRMAFEQQLAATPTDPQAHVLRGLVLAYLGRKAEAIEEGLRGVKLLPISRDAFAGAYNQHQLARIYLLVGEPEKALDQLEPLLKTPYFLSPGWLRIDPTFDPIRNNPRFQKLVMGGR